MGLVVFYVSMVGSYGSFSCLSLRKSFDLDGYGEVVSRFLVDTIGLFERVRDALTSAEYAYSVRVVQRLSCLVFRGG